MVPIHVDARCELPIVQVARLDASGFHVWTPGNFPIIIRGYQHILVQDHLAEFLESHHLFGLAVAPAYIIRLASGERRTDYRELLIDAEVTPETIGSVDVTGKKVWHFDRRYLFVSSELRDALRQPRLEQLSFSEGFSEFG
jgi:hypothetical protein